MGELGATVGVVAELVPGRARGGEQHGVAGAGQLAGSPHHRIHHRHVPSLRAVHLDHRDIGRVSRQRVAHPGAVGTEQHGAAQPGGVGAHEVVEDPTLGQAPGDPHHRVVGGQRGLGGMRVGGLAVVDEGDPVDHGHLGDAVRLGHEVREPLRHGGRSHADGAGQRGGCQRIGRVVRSGRVHHSKGSKGHDRLRGALDQSLVQHTDLPGPGLGQGERHATATGPQRRLSHQVTRRGIVGVVDRHAHAPVVDDPFGCSVGLERPVPVEVVGGQVQHDGPLGGHGAHGVQLGRAELDRQHVVLLPTGDDGDERDADVADSQAAPTVGPQDRLQHAGRGGLAVRAGDHEPRGRTRAA